MGNEQHIKSLNTDTRGKNRLRYSSAREKAKTASADVYRSYKRRIGVTSAASREERVHHPQQDEGRRKKKRQRTATCSDSADRVAVLGGARDESEHDSDYLDTESTFASELDLAHDRNASEIFSRFYHEVWHLARSLPEVLHHASEIVDILMSYLLSPEQTPEEKSDLGKSGEKRVSYVTNQATTDILHLLAVLARDLRHEIHPFVYSQILPRIIHDFLNPPLPPPKSGRQPLPMNVTVVEAAFRAMSYVFRYDGEPILTEVEISGQEPFLEKMRQFYGATLGHKRDYVRRLAAESFAPLVRKIKTDGARRKHIRRVLRALAASSQKDETFSHSLKRAQSDAVDGVSCLLFETTRGMSGRLHSRGHLVIRCVFDCLTGNSAQNGIEILYLVSSALVEKICHHVRPENFDAVWKEVFRAANVVLRVAGRVKINNPVWSVLRLIDQIVSFKTGIFIRKPDKNGGIANHAQCVKDMVELFQIVFHPEMFRRLSYSAQRVALDVLCDTWRALPNNPAFGAQLSPLLPALLTLDMSEGTDVEHDRLNAATAIAQGLLPYLPSEIGMKLVGRAILRVAAKQSTTHSIRSLMLLFSVVSVKPSKRSDSDNIDDHDNIFVLDNASLCNISSVVKETLIDLCLLQTICEHEVDSLARVVIAARCLPFVLLAGGANGDSGKDSASGLMKIWRWSLDSLKTVDSEIDCVSVKGSEKANVDDIVVTKSLILESCARMALVCYDTVDDSVVKKCVLQIRPHAERFLMSHPRSISAIKSISACTEALGKFNTKLSDSTNEVFEALIPNLRHKSHFLRLHTLEILASYPKRPFVTDHGEIDWTDDLDEELSTVPYEPNQDHHRNSTIPTGPCDIIDSLLKLESTPINLSSERKLTSIISRVEVLGRTGRLPVVYVETASSHMLGVLYSKYSPIWQAATRALISLAMGHEACVWEPLYERIRETTANIAFEDETEFLECDPVDTPADHLRMCVAWESSTGGDPGLFRDEATTAKDVGRVSRHLSTDESTMFGLVWSVLEGCPELTAKKSRAIVPIFLEFLHLQYFLYYDDDPDARELRLHDEINDPCIRQFVREDLSRLSVNRRLLVLLKVFAAVNGPQQLYKHKLLFSIFTSFVSHRDAATAQAALSCVLKFKQPYIAPYADILRGMLKKGELRNTMLNFSASKEANFIDPEHRSVLIPLLTRIMFGRLSARVSVSKSSKETPSARRAAVLCFFSDLDGSDDELYPLFYLMVRSYIPKHYPVKPIENQDAEDRRTAFQWLNSIKSGDVALLPNQRHEGFLNLLSSAVAQLGHDIEMFLPAFMSIVMCLCRHAMAKHVAAEDTVVEEDDDDPDNEDGEPRLRKTRNGTIRTLCSRRLAEVYKKYASSIDFLPYAKSMWDALAVSVHELPITVAYAEKAPALLVLMQTLSSHPSLIPILAEHEGAVPSILKCVSDTSMPSVAHATLDFVENLLTNGGEEVDTEVTVHSVGVHLLQKNLSLLLHQFAVRLGANSRVEKRSPAIKANYTTRRELSILCRVSGLVVQAGSTSRDSAGSVNQQEVLQKLCDLLLPFLSLDRRTNEVDQVHVIGILCSIFPRIEGETTLNYLPVLSRLLGPHKGHRGITSLHVRKSVSSAMNTIAKCNAERKDLQKVTGVTVQLCSVHPKRVDEIDYDEVLCGLNDLGVTENSRNRWVELACRESSSDEASAETDPATLSPLVCLCFHFLYDEDGVVSRTAFKALKCLIFCAAQESENGIEGAPSSRKWAKFIETTVVPMCLNGLTCRNQSFRRFFVLLLSELARSFERHPSPHLYGDLSCLIRDDDPDIDFFLNITHVQIHRRSRALQRLCKTLMAGSSDERASRFSMQSLSRVLLPLAMHPIYESKTKAEEPLTLDSAETVGAIARHLSWSKYHATLWTMLTQFERHKEQERYIIEAICSVIDAFHFELFETTENASRDINPGDNNNSLGGNAVWRALENRIIPRVEILLVQEKVIRSGTKVKTLRPSVVLALLKLFQKFPVAVFEARLSRLLVVICDALKSRDSDSREVARKTLAKMVTGTGVCYLSDVIRQLTITLTEGYQLHVRMAALHTILQALEVTYEAQRESFPEEHQAMLPFDNCIPAIMDLIQQDLFGIAREHKEADGARKRLVKEASGSKSMDSIELICRMLVFRPSAIADSSHNNASQASFSSVHAVVMPFLERLRSPDTDMTTIGRVGECLTRVVLGLSRNESVCPEEVLPFIYASLAPFVGKYQPPSTGGGNDSSEDEDSVTDLQISRTEASRMAGSKSPSAENVTVRQNVIQWRPSAINALENSSEARKMKNLQRMDLHRVRDGASAPKLTGSGRYISNRPSSSQGLNEPASISAVTFGLTLLNSCMKKAKFDVKNLAVQNMLDPFISMLTTCVCGCRNNNVVLLSLRALGVLLRLDLPSVPEFSSTLGTHTLDILTSSGTIGNLHQELAQGCFKTLSLLINMDASPIAKPSATAIENGENVLQGGNAMPLGPEQMQALISLLKVAAVDSDHHHSALALIKAIVSRRFLSPELYDLMDTILDLSVRSQKATVRQLSAKIFMQYLVDYPMGKERLEDHLKRVVLNVKYDHEEGRLSAVALVTAIIEKLPIELLEAHAGLFFLPLVLQFVNDESKECREALSRCLSRLLSRAPEEVAQSFYDYSVRWSSGAGPLQRTSLQLFGLFVDARFDFLNRGDNARELVDRLYGFLRNEDTDSGWEILYFALVCLEKLTSSSLGKTLMAEVDLGAVVIKNLTNPHPWVKRVSSRMIAAQLNALDPASFASDDQLFLVKRPGSLYEIARNLCSHLDLDETEQDTELSTTAIKSLTWIVQAMNHHPALCFDEDADDDEDDRNPVTWLMVRLSNIAKPKGTKRRQGVFKCFAAFATIGGVSLLLPYLELMIQPLHRSAIESESIVDSVKTSLGSQPAEESEEAALAREVLGVLEESCGDAESEKFLQAYGAVKAQAREKREERKKRAAEEMVRDPEAAALRKMKKHDQERKRRKRKVEEHRQKRGGKAKRRHF